MDVRFRQHASCNERPSGTSYDVIHGTATTSYTAHAAQPVRVNVIYKRILAYGRMGFGRYRADVASDAMGWENRTHSI